MAATTRTRTSALVLKTVRQKSIVTAPILGVTSVIHVLGTQTLLRQHLAATTRTHMCALVLLMCQNQVAQTPTFGLRGVIHVLRNRLLRQHLAATTR